MANPAINQIKIQAPAFTTSQLDKLDFQRNQLAGNISAAIIKQNPTQATLPQIKKIVRENIQVNNDQLEIDLPGLAEALAANNMLEGTPQQAGAVLAKILAQFQPTGNTKADYKSNATTSRPSGPGVADHNSPPWVMDQLQINSASSDVLVANETRSKTDPAATSEAKSDSISAARGATDLGPAAITASDIILDGARTVPSIARNAEGLGALVGSSKFLGQATKVLSHTSTGIKVAGEAGLALQVGWAAIDQTAFLVENNADFVDYVLTIPTRIIYDVSLGTGASIVALVEATGAALGGENFFEAWGEASNSRNTAMQYFIPIKFNQTDQYNNVISWDASGLIDTANYMAKPMNLMQTSLYFLGMDGLGDRLGTVKPYVESGQFLSDVKDTVSNPLQLLQNGFYFAGADNKGDIVGEMKFNLANGRYGDAYVSYVTLVAGEDAGQAADTFVHETVPQTAREIQETGAELWAAGNFWSNQAVETGSQLVEDGQYMIQKWGEEAKEAVVQTAAIIETTVENTVQQAKATVRVAAQTAVDNLTQAGQFVSSLF